MNLDQLGRRNPEHYGDLTLARLDQAITGWGRDLGLEVRVFQTNFEGEFVEKLHKLGDLTDGVVLNPGAWTHYSWAIRDALEIAALPAIEVHLSDVQAREEFRRSSVISDLCVATFSGHGADGYRMALERLRAELEPE